MENPHRKYMVYFMENPIYRYWLVVSTPLKNMTVSWDYYSQYMEKYFKKIMFQTTNQYNMMNNNVILQVVQEYYQYMKNNNNNNI